MQECWASGAVGESVRGAASPPCAAARRSTWIRSGTRLLLISNNEGYLHNVRPQGALWARSSGLGWREAMLGAVATNPSSLLAPRRQDRSSADP